MSENKKWEFIENELWLMTFGGAFQRSKIYKKGITEGERRDFRNAVKLYVRNNIVGKNYDTGMDEEQHLRNIIKICEWSSKKYGHILYEGKLRVGTAQKILNLYLKYLWCLDKIDTPPHCPLDNKIISMIDSKSSIKWTELDDISKYKKLIEKIDSRSIADWELENYLRK